MDIILRNTPHGPLEATMEVLQTEGLTGFWRGNLLNIIRTAPFKVPCFKVAARWLRGCVGDEFLHF